MQGKPNILKEEGGVVAIAPYGAGAGDRVYGYGAGAGGCGGGTSRRVMPGGCDEEGDWMTEETRR